MSLDANKGFAKVLCNLCVAYRYYGIPMKCDAICLLCKNKGAQKKEVQAFSLGTFFCFLL